MTEVRSFFLKTKKRRLTAHFASAIIFALILSACSQSPNSFQQSGGSNEGTSISAGALPSDVLRHIVFSEGGGAGGIQSGTCPCVNINGTQISISGLAKNQTYSVVVYELYTNETRWGNFLEGEYYSHWQIETGSSTLMEVTAGRLPNRNHIIIWDSSGKMVYGGILVRDPEDFYEELEEIYSWPCRDSYETRLWVGMTGYVEPDPTGGNNVREGAGLSHLQVGRIAVNERFKVIEGPRCSDGWIWWKIESLNTGLIGWTSEGESGNYWLAPEN